MLDMETIGYFLYMEEQEKQAIENRSTELFSTTSENERTKTDNQD